MELMEAVLTRRSIRRYTGAPVSEADLTAVLRAASYAPSAHNRQPWHFVVLQDPSVVARLSEFHPYVAMGAQAGTVVAVCGDLGLQPELGFLVEDCSAAIQNMLLAAVDRGLGSVWCGVYPKDVLIDGVRALLGLPGSIVPVGLVVLGHPDEERVAEERFDPAKVHRDRWSAEARP